MEIIWGMKMQLDHAEPPNRVEPYLLFPEINFNEENVEDIAVHRENDNHDSAQHSYPRIL